MPWNGSWNEYRSHPVHCVRPGQIPETLVQAERRVRRSSPLLIRGFGVRVLGGAPVLCAPVLTCSESLFGLRSWPGVERTLSARCSGRPQGAAATHTYAGYNRRTILPALGSTEVRKVRGPLLDTTTDVKLAPTAYVFASDLLGLMPWNPD